MKSSPMWAFPLCLVLSCLVWAQSTNSNTEAQQKITDMETEMTAALLKGDLAGSEKYLSSNYVRIYPDGTVAPTDDLRNALKFTALEVSDQQVRVTGDTAVSVFKSNVQATANGQPLDGTYLGVRTWAKDHGEWKAVSFASIRLVNNGGSDSSQTSTSAKRAPPKEHAHIKDNVFSDDLSKLTLTVDPKFRYLGSFPFDIHDIAGGYRYVWGEIDHGKHLRRTFIIQAEGFYSDNQESYRYGTPNPATLAGDPYQHNVWIDDNEKDARESPGTEADLTRAFFKERGYEWEPQLVMSRFARIVDESKKNEIIFFYFENLGDYTKRRAADFSEEAKTPEQQAIHNAVDANSRKAFQVSH